MLFLTCDVFSIPILSECTEFVDVVGGCDLNTTLFLVDKATVLTSLSASHIDATDAPVW